MKLTSSHRRFGCFALAYLALCDIAEATAEDFQLVINPPPEVKSLSLNEARSIFSMRLKSWPKGTPITVFVLPDHTHQHEDFVRENLKLLPHQLKRNWERMVYTGTGQAPTEVADEAEMIRQLQETPGSIGYVSKEVDNESLHFIEIR